MDGYGINERPAENAGYCPIAFKDCASELKRQGVERLLSAVYRREVTLLSMLYDQNLSESAIEALKCKGLDFVTERLIEEIRNSICHLEQGERRFVVLERYYGLDGHLPARMTGLATRYGVTRERIRQIKERSLVALRGKKCTIESALVSLAMHAAGSSGLRTPGRGQGVSQSNPQGEPDHFRLLKHSQLLMMDQSLVPNTVEQDQALDIINSVPRVMVAGCAGSGKTWLALSLATRLAHSGQRTLLTCFNRGLADYLTNLIPERENLVVASFHALCLRIGKQAGLTIPGGWNNRVYMERFPEVLKDAMLSDPSLKFDAIIVDDGHEFKENWWQALESGLKHPMRSRLCCFMDDNNLSFIQQAAQPDVDLTARLSINLRSPASVAPLLIASCYPPSRMRFIRETASAIEFWRCESDEDFQTTLIHLISELVDKGDYIPSEIVVLTHRDPRFSSAAGVQLKGTARLVKRQTEVSSHTGLIRSHAFFGLERRAIIVVDLDDRFARMSQSDIKCFIYKAFSRFVDCLFVLGSRESWDVIERLSLKQMQMERQKDGIPLRNYRRDGALFSLSEIPHKI